MQQRHHAAGCARAKARLAQGQFPDVERVESIHVLDRANAIGDGRLIDVGRQRQLHQDAVDVRILVQVVDQVQQRVLAGHGVEIEIPRKDTGPLAVPALGPHVNGRGRVGTDQHHGEAGPSAAFADVCLDGIPHP